MTRWTRVRIFLATMVGLFPAFLGAVMSHDGGGQHSLAIFALVGWSAGAIPTYIFLSFLGWAVRPTPGDARLLPRAGTGGMADAWGSSDDEAKVIDVDPLPTWSASPLMNPLEWGKGFNWSAILPVWAVVVGIALFRLFHLYPWG